MPSPAEIAERLRKQREAAQRGFGALGRKQTPPQVNPMGAMLDSLNRLRRGQRVTERSLREAMTDPRPPSAYGWRPYAPAGRTFALRQFGATPMPARTAMQRQAPMHGAQERAILPQQAVPGGTLLNPVQRPVTAHQYVSSFRLPGGAPLSQVRMEDVHRGMSANASRGTGTIGMTTSRDLAINAVTPRPGTTALVNRGRAIRSMDGRNPIHTAQPGMAVGASRYF